MWEELEEAMDSNLDLFLDVVNFPYFIPLSAVYLFCVVAPSPLGGSLRFSAISFILRVLRRENVVF